MSSTLLKTPLHQIHVELGGKMVPFAGYDMPVQYSGIIEEHLAVRNAAGLFDVSHMGEVRVRGPHAAEFIQNLVTNDVNSLYDGRAMYTVMCRPDGGIVDDLLVYRIEEDDYLLVINASNRTKDFDWMVSNNPMKADLEDVSDDIALIAIQGPEALSIVQELTERPLADLKFYHFLKLESGEFLGADLCYLSHTGYTGEPGLEIYCDVESAARIWNALLDTGASRGLKPAGLGARDTLRLESGFCLYGNDITDDTNPLEAGLGWVTKLKKEGGFIGRDALNTEKENGSDRRLIGFKLVDRGIPRSGYSLVAPDASTIGSVTSGTQSPLLSCGIGLGYVQNRPEFTTPGSSIGLEVRGKVLSAVVTKPPFHK